MNRTPLKDKLLDMQRNQSSLLATNFYNYETLRGVMEAAVAVKQPLILQVTKSSIDYLGLNMAVSMAHAAFRQYNVDGWLHLDHSESLELVSAALAAGFDSVMIDASEKPIEKNIELTKKAVQLAAKYGANVEAELGYIAKLGQSSETEGFTDPILAQQFVEETGVNALAVAIGTAHGFYKSEPKLDIERLKNIHASTKVALVLHGGSGIPAASLREAINNGICKVNLATEIKNIFIRTLHDCFEIKDEIDLRKLFPPAIKAVRHLVSEKLDIVK